MKTKAIIAGICLLFLVCGYLVNFRILFETKQKGITLDQSLYPIPGWKSLKKHELLDVIVSELQLDDYTNQTFSNGEDVVSLYIGYYYSAKKVGASHDPMVCFPGQGWKIDNRSKGTIGVTNNIKKPFEYATMVTELGENTDLLVYWFQAYDEPASSTFWQKVRLAKKRLAGKNEDNAFVRVTTSCNTKKFDSCRQVAINFIDDFYPRFLGFVTTNTM